MMKKISFLLYCLAVTLVVAITEATEPAITSSGVYVGVRGSRLNWKTQDLHYLGYLIGPSVGIDYRKPMNVYAGYRFYWMTGHVDAGSSGRNTQLMNMQARLGFTFGEKLLVSPYFGLGVDIVDFTSHHRQLPCGHLAYTNVNVPVGVILSYHPSRSFSIGIDYQYLPEVDAYSRLGGFKNVRFELQEKGEHSVEIPIQFSFPEPRWRCIQYRLIPFYRTYYYGMAKLTCSCTCETNPTVVLSSQRAYEWGLRYEVAIW